MNSHKNRPTYLHKRKNRPTYLHKQFSDFRRQANSFATRQSSFAKDLLVAGYRSSPASDVFDASRSILGSSGQTRGLKRTFKDTPIGVISRNTREVMDGAAQTAIDGCNFLVHITNKWFQLRNPKCFQSINFPPPHIPRTVVNPPIATGIYVLVSRGWRYRESYTHQNIGRSQRLLKSRREWKYTFIDGQFPWKDPTGYTDHEGKVAVSRTGAAWSEYYIARGGGYPYTETSWSVGKEEYGFKTYEEWVREFATISDWQRGDVRVPNLPGATAIIGGLSYEQVLYLVGEDGKGLNQNYRDINGSPDGEIIPRQDYTIDEGYVRWSAYEIGAVYGFPQMMIGGNMGEATDRQILQLLLKRVGNLPANVPDLFTKQKPTTIKIESLAELTLWQTQQLDALMGNYPIEIEIQDTDLVKEGNQSRKIVLPNNSEAIAEILGLVIATKKESSAILTAAMKALTEAGMTKQVAIKTLDVGLANAEYLGYNLQQIVRKVPMTFTPGADGLDASLKQSEVDVVSYDNKSKHDLQDFINKVQKMVARWNAQNWRQLGKDLIGDLRKHLVGGVKDINTQVESDKDGDFSTFTEEIEQGFIGTTGITDKTNPWGAPYTERPKIRVIGDNVGEDSTPG